MGYLIKETALLLKLFFFLSCFQESTKAHHERPRGPHKTTLQAGLKSIVQ
jgi:hypothetical protein